MEQLRILPLDINYDIPIIKSWENKFKDDSRFDGIKHFVLEDNLYYGLDEVILTNYEFFHIGDDERKFVLTVRNEEDIPVGFILACTFNLSINKPELIIQYLVLSPEYQNKGYGAYILNELLKNTKQYFSCSPQEVSADVEKENLQSLNLLKKFGFNFSPHKDKNDYLRVNKIIKTLEEEKI